VNDTCLAEALPAASDCVVTDHHADGATDDVPFQIIDDPSCAGSKQRVQLNRVAQPAFDTYATLSCAPPSL